MVAGGVTGKARLEDILECLSKYKSLYPLTKQFHSD